jgi:PPM family protein phosphatase
MNQDSMAVLSAEELDCKLDGLYVVADGMGGKAGGEIASRVTVEIVPAVVEEILSEQTEPLGTQLLADALREALEAANEAVYTQARANPELRGMGTTCVAAIVRGSQAIIGNVGDSRIYLLRDRRLTQLTSDHSLVQEHVRSGELTAEQARGSRFKNVITRAIGIASAVDPDVDLVELQPGDTLLLCSDGLTNMVSEGSIAHILGTFEDLDECCRRLVDQAKKNGGIDNITTVVVRHGPFNRAGQPEIVEAEDATPVLQRPPTARRKSRFRLRYVLMALLAIETAILIMLTGQIYEFAPGWPFVQPRKVETPRLPTPPPPPDYAKLTYAEPVIVLNKPVRGNALECDPAGNAYVVSAQSGAVLRIATDGSATTLASADPAPKLARADRYWATDPQGNLYVSSSVDKSITKFDRGGARLATIGKGSLKSPQAIAVDAKGDIRVIDSGILKVLKAAAANGPG